MKKTTMRQAAMKLALLAAVLLAPMVSWGQETTVTIGDGTATSNTNPIGTYYNYSIAEQLYTAEEIGMAGTISSISFYYRGIAARDLPITVYMANVDAEDLSDGGISLADADEVFSGTLSVTTTAGWVTINLDTPFDYDGSSNLLIGCIKDYLYYFSGQTWQGTATPSTMARYNQNDNHAYTTSTTPSGTTNNRPNIQIVITPAASDCPNPNSFVISDVATHTAVATWGMNDATYVGNFNLQYKKTTDDDDAWTPVSLGNVRTYTLTGLDAETEYQTRIQTVCTPENTLWKNATNFTTLVACPAPTNLAVTNGSITAHGATVTWNGTSSNGYVVMIGQENFPVRADFETGDLSQADFTATSIYPWTVVANTHSGAYCAKSGNGGQHSTTSNLYLNVTLSADATLTFSAKVSSEGGWDKAYFSIDGVDKINAISGNGNWIDYSYPLTAGTHTLRWYYSKDGSGEDFDDCFYVDDIVISAGVDSWTEYNTNAQTYTFTNLTPNRHYLVKVKGNCGDEGFSSASAPVNFTTLESCVMPTGLTASDVTAHEATISWTSDADAWQICVNDDEENLIDVTETTYNFTGLTPETTYSVKVRTNCGNEYSDWNNNVTFTTAISCPAPTGFAAMPNSITAHTADLTWQGTSNSYQVAYRTAAYVDGLEEDFSANPTGWLFRTGALNADGTATLSGTSGWGHNADNGVFDQHISMNMYSHKNYWLITPSMEIQDGYALNLDMAYTAYSGTQAAPAPNCPTHRFAVLISIDDMTTWSILREWNNSGSEYVLDDIPNTGMNSGNIDLSAYAGQTAYIAFFGYSETSDYDNNFHFDNVAIGIAVPAGEMQYASNITEQTVTLQGLLAERKYEATLQGDCEDEGVSAVVGPITFTTDIACTAPTALTNGTPSPSEVELTWVKNGEETEWQICINNDEENLVDVAEADVNVNSETSVVTYTLTNLTPSTSYETKVRANCGDVDGHSAWTSPVSFTTQAACPTPVLNASGITNITAHTADVEWSNFTENTNYEVSYRTAAYFDGVSEEFGTTTPTGWARYTGLLSNVMNGIATLNSVTSGWSFGTSCGVFDYHAKVNIYGSSCNKWLVTPEMIVPEDGVLNFDMALTAYSDSNVPAPSTNGTDDKFVVLITTDEMATWTVLREWNNSGSDYVLNDIACTATGENVMIDLSDYVGQNIKIAFYGESTASNADNYLHIDNVAIGVEVAAGDWVTENDVTENSFQLTNLEAETSYDVKVAGYCDATVAGESDIQSFTTTIACPVPTGLAIVGDATTNSVDLTWTAGAVNQDAWQICLNGDETNLLDVTDATVTGTTVTYTLTGLTSGADYSVKVRANCGDMDGVSLQWTNTVNFTTEASCTEPTAFAVVENSVEAHQAQLSWTASGEETAWDIYYSTENTAPVNGVTPPTVGAIAANPYTLAGLDAATTYYVWVRAHCGDAAGQQSPWVGPVSFTTACEAITTFPWSENFESYTASSSGVTFAANCWENIHLAGSGSYFFEVYSGSYAVGNSTNTLRLRDMNSGTMTKLRLPVMDLPDENYQFSIDVYRNASGTSYTSEGVRVYASTDGEIEGATELGFLSRNYTQADGGVVGAENASGWYTYEFPIPFSGTCYIILRGESQYGSATYMDNFVVEVAPTCRKPKTPVCDSKTAHTATLSWTNGEEGQTAWQIAYSTNTTDFTPDNDFTPDETTTWLVDANTNPFTINGLNANTPYRAYVRANCGTEDGVSNWSVLPANFTTLAGNNAPTGLAVPDISVSSSSAIATWNANAANELHQLYELYINTDETAPTAESTPSYTTNETSYTFTGLTPETQYFVWVRDNCGTDGISAWVGSASFTTQASCPTPVLNADGITNITAHTADVEWSNFTENTNYEVSYRTAAYFTGETEEFGNDIPTGWARYTGLLNDGGTPTLNSVSDGWFFGTANGVFDNHARLNIYSTNCNRWLVTPALTVPENGALTFDMALTAFSGALAAPQTTGTDDKFVVLITTDEMATWTVLREWNNSGTEYVYNNIVCSATGENVMIDLGEYVGQTVRIAFYGESTIANADNELHIDNVGVGVAVAAGDWETENVTENSLQLTNLVAETSYEVKVAGYCDETVGGESATQTFTTEAFCPAPTNVAYSDVTPHGATITWEGEAANHVIEYRTVTTVDVDYTYDFEDGMQGWTTIDADGHGDAWYLGDNNNAHNGTYSMQTNYNPSYDHQDYLVSPQIALGGSISFYAKKAADWLNDRFRVYLSTTSNTSASDFTIELTNGDVSPSVTYDLYSYDLSNYSGMGYVAIVYTAPANQYFISIDDINITGTVVSGYGEWQTVDNATSPYELNTLTPETNYEVTVVGDCGATTSPANDTVGFTTLEACGVPTAFTLGTITTNEATFSWTAGIGNTEWQVFVKKHADAEYPAIASATVNAATATINGLDDATVYDVKIVPDCDATKVLEVANAFTTECETTVVDADNSFFEGFEGTTFPPICWSVGDPSNNNNWQSSTDNSNTGSASAYSNFNGPIYLYTPTIHIDGTTATLSFSSYNNFADWYEYGGKNSVLVSVNGGDWTEIWSPASVSESWVVTTIDMTAYVGQNIQLCFKYEGDGAHGWFIDDVNLFVPTVIEKAIEANKWYAISSPRHDAGQTYESVPNVTNLIPATGAYDLYYYNESNTTWMNYKAEEFNLEQGHGYIYRRDAATTLDFTGENNTADVEVDLTATPDAGSLMGFNLVGNPFLREYTLNSDCYNLTTNGVWTVNEGSYTLGIAEAVMVKATNDETLTFTYNEEENVGAKAGRSAALAFTLAGNGFEDVAYARFADGEGMPKLGHLNSEAPMLSIALDNRRYAIANLDYDCQSFPLVLRATAGEYTIALTSHLSPLTYCHLLDRATGSDIDLLKQGSYTFNATSNDADRFTVKLSPDALDNAGSNFVYWNGTSWTVEGNGTLGVYDVMGRQLFSGEVNSQLSILNSQFPSTGVYILRLGEKSQKIVVK